MGFARAQPILPRLANEGIPRVMASAMVPTMAPEYSGESFMRRSAFDVMENLRCKSCRD
jgi:hypothetical protein